MKRTALPAGIGPQDMHLSGLDLATTLLHLPDGGVHALVQMRVRYVEALAQLRAEAANSQPREMTLKPLRMSPAQARDLARRLVEFADLSEAAAAAAPSSVH